MADHDNDPAIETSTVEVRQGDRRRLNLRVLVISLTAAVVVLGLIYLAFFKV